MKTINKTLIGLVTVVAVGLTFSACSEFLETEPASQISESEYYSSEEEMMKGLYSLMDEVQIRLMEVWSYSSLLSDESETGGGIGEGSYKTKWDNFSYDANSCFGAWGYGSWWNEWDYGLYNGVIAANKLIDHLSNCDLNENFVHELEAEAKFYRALFYDYLWMGYEEIPLITKSMLPDDMYNVHKGTRQEVYDFMLSDLDDAVTQYLPERSATPQGRVCRDAAKLLRTKIILFHRDEAKYQTALNDMKEIINSGRYSLLPNYQDLWWKKGEWGKESIYEVAFAGKNTGEGNGICRSVGGRNLIDPRSAEQGGLCEGYGQNTMPSTIYNMFELGDSRREGTVIVWADEAKKVDQLIADGKLNAGSRFNVSDQQENYEGLGHYKYQPRKESASDINPLYNYAASYRFYRYADVLLLATELQVRVSGKVDSDGQKWFDQIRDRAFQNTNHRIDLGELTKQQALDTIFKERGYEFIDEMQRWFDILRFDKGTEILGKKGWTEKFRYFPIDQSEIDRSNGNLTQNPGWAK
jgi:hypothetical protein